MRDVVRLSSLALDPLDLLARVAARIRTAVPYDAAGWLVTDPAAGLNTGVVPINVDGGLQRRLIEAEIVHQDVNMFRTIARARSPVALLSRATGGELSRSVRHRMLYAPNGYGDELRAVFRTGPSVWGRVCLSRYEDRPPFSAEEADVVRRVAGHVAEGLRTGHLRATATAGAGTPGTAASPGVVVVDGAGQIESMTDAAREHLARLATPGLEAPMGVYEVAERARQLATEDGVLPPATVRVRAGHATWFVLHGSRLDDGRCVVVVEPARPAELAPIIVAVHGLTPRERQVTEL